MPGQFSQYIPKPFRSVLKVAAPKHYSDARKVENAVFASFKNKPLPQPPISKVLKGTKLGRYLDQKYEKKCGVEVKHYQSQQNYSITTTLAGPTVFQFPLDQTITQGTGMSSRVGATYEVKSLTMHCSITPNATNNAAVRVRLFLVKMGKQINGAQAPVAQIIWFTNDIRSECVPKSETNVDFTVIEEKVFTLAPIGSSSHQDRVDFKWDYYPKSCHTVEFSDTDTGGFVNTVDRGMLQIYAMYETAGTAGLPLMKINYEYNWIDS